MPSQLIHKSIALTTLGLLACGTPSQANRTKSTSPGHSMELSGVVVGKSVRHGCRPTEEIFPSDDDHTTSWHAVECKRSNPGPSGVSCHSSTFGDRYCTVGNIHIPADGTPDITEAQLTGQSYDAWIVRQVSKARKRLRDGQSMAVLSEVFALSGPEKSPWLHQDPIRRNKYSIKIANVMGVTDAPGLSVAVARNNEDIELDEQELARSGIPLELAGAPALFWGEFGFATAEASSIVVTASSGVGSIGIEALSFLAKGAIARGAAASFQIAGILEFFFPILDDAEAYFVHEVRQIDGVTSVEPATQQNTVVSGEWSEAQALLVRRTLELASAHYGADTLDREAVEKHLAGLDLPETALDDAIRLAPLNADRLEEIAETYGKGDGSSICEVVGAENRAEGSANNHVMCERGRKAIRPSASASYSMMTLRARNGNPTRFIMGKLHYTYGPRRLLTQFPVPMGDRLSAGAHGDYSVTPGFLRSRTTDVLVALDVIHAVYSAAKCREHLTYMVPISATGARFSSFGDSYLVQFPSGGSVQLEKCLPNTLSDVGRL